MWLLSFLSDMIIHTVTIIGVLGVIVSFFVPSNPIIAQYGLPSRILSVIILAVGIFFEGTIFKDKIWEARIAEAQQKVLQAEILAAEANSKIQYVYIIEKQEVEKKRQEVQTKIRSESQKIDMTCVVAPEAIDILNISAGAKK